MGVFRVWDVRGMPKQKNVVVVVHAAEDTQGPRKHYLEYSDNAVHLMWTAAMETLPPVVALSWNAISSPAERCLLLLSSIESYPFVSLNATLEWPTPAPSTQSEGKWFAKLAVCSFLWLGTRDAPKLAGFAILPAHLDLVSGHLHNACEDHASSACFCAALAGPDFSDNIEKWLALEMDPEESADLYVCERAMQDFRALRIAAQDPPGMWSNSESDANTVPGEVICDLQALFTKEMKATWDTKNTQRCHVLGIEKWTTMALSGGAVGLSEERLSHESTVRHWKRQMKRQASATYQWCQSSLLLGSKSIYASEFRSTMRKVMIPGPMLLSRWFLLQNLFRQRLPLHLASSHEPTSFEGAHVEKPVLGLHAYMVLLDFVGLYPSIIVHHKLCFTPEGQFLPALVQQYLTLRAEAKSRVLVEGDKHDLRQRVYKFVLNEMYGCLGNAAFPFYDPILAANITRFGREAIRFVIALARRKPFSMRVVFADTDSVGLTGWRDRPACLLGRFLDRVKRKTGILLKIEYAATHVLIRTSKSWAMVPRATQWDPVPTCRSRLLKNSYECDCPPLHGGLQLGDPLGPRIDKGIESSSLHACPLIRVHTTWLLDSVFKLCDEASENGLPLPVQESLFQLERTLQRRMDIEKQSCAHNRPLADFLFLSAYRKTAAKSATKDSLWKTQLCGMLGVYSPRNGDMAHTCHLSDGATHVWQSVVEALCRSGNLFGPFMAPELREQARAFSGGQGRMGSPDIDLDRYLQVLLCPKMQRLMQSILATWPAPPPCAQ